MTLQTEEQAIEAAAQARAEVTGDDVGQIKRSLMASVNNSIAGTYDQYQAIAAAFVQYAEADGALQFGRSNATDIETVSAEVGKGRVTVVPEYYDEGDHVVAPSLTPDSYTLHP